MSSEVNVDSVVHRVVPKAGQQAKQYVREVIRVFKRKGTKDVTNLHVKVGYLISVDWCPEEMFIVAEIEGFLRTNKPKCVRCCSVC
jgi:hypothetical protein